MLSKFSLKNQSNQANQNNQNKQKKDLILLLIQIHCFVLILIGVLWMMSQLKKQQPPAFFKLFFSAPQQQYQPQNQ